ncbi:MAG TPA: hypothetical protein VG184_10710 [Acidimicrobiales bacterium]|jgi:hypothetical protein|nr:hypothetical protein [Acidimicrobiales bacterium]
MTWALIGVVVVLVVAIVATFRVARSARAALAGAAARAATAEAGIGEAQRSAADAAVSAETLVAAERSRAQLAADRATQAEARLALARQEAATSVPEPGVAHLQALWSLALLDQDRSWRLTMALPQGTDDGHRSRSLADALEGEVSRIREETGTPGTLEVSLDDEPGPGDALLVLRCVQGLLAVLARHSQAFDLRVVTGDGRLVATVACDDFDGPDTVADETTALLSAVRGARGEVDIDRDTDGRLRATFSLPAS